MIVISSLLLVACGGSGGGSDENGDGGNPSAPGNDQPPPDPVSPTPGVPVDGGGDFHVVRSVPEADAVNRALNTKVTLTFNKPLIASTVTSDSIYLLQGSQAQAVSLSYTDGAVSVEMSFAQALEPSTIYTVGVSRDLMSEDGESFTPGEWSFQTAGNVGATSQEVIDQCMSDADINMLDAVNEARAQARLCGSNNYPVVPALSWSCLLEEAAHNHSQDMQTNDFFSHTGSDGSSLSQRISGVGYRWNSVAENIAAGYTSISSVMAGWLQSPGHCANIMRASVTELGASRVDGAGSTHRNYWTQNFARPR